MKLVHFGDNKFDINKFYKVEDTGFVKPIGGLWTSPIESSWGWKDFVGLSEEVNSHFVVDFFGNPLIINSKEDLEQIPFEDSGYDFLIPKFESCSFDAIWLTAKGERETRYTLPKSLYGWDVETVYILNPYSIKS